MDQLDEEIALFMVRIHQEYLFSVGYGEITVVWAKANCETECINNSWKNKKMPGSLFKQRIANIFLIIIVFLRKVHYSFHFLGIFFCPYLIRTIKNA